MQGFSVLNGHRTSICAKYFTHTHTHQSSGEDIKPTFKSANHQAQSTWIKTNVYLRLV